MDFTNPFLDFNQGYTRPFITILPTVKATLFPIVPEEEEESVLPKKPLTRKELKTHRGYPRGESQGDSSGRIPLPSFLTRMLKNIFKSVRGRMMTSKYWHDGLRDLGLGDAVMVSKERWRKHINELDLETFPKSWIGRGLREIHHEGDVMDGHMDACLGFAAVMGCEIY